jgi:hypothetical protein
MATFAKENACILYGICDHIAILSLRDEKLKFLLLQKYN